MKRCIRLPGKPTPWRGSQTKVPKREMIRSVRASDGQEIRLDLSIIFRINYEQVVALHADWQDRYIEDFVRPVIRSLVRTQVSQFTVKEVNSSAHKDLEATLDRLITAELAAQGWMRSIPTPRHYLYQ